MDKNLKNYLNKQMKNGDDDKKQLQIDKKEESIWELDNESNGNLGFELDDIESLQDADLDKDLLENHFINRETKEEVLKK